MTDTKSTTVESIVADREAETKVKAAKPETKVKAERSKEPVAYTSASDAYVDSRYYKAGEVFVTTAPKGDDWTKVSPKEAAAIEASTNDVPDDANLEEADVSALQAVAIMKHVPIVGIAKDKKALITAIKAAYEPAL